MSEVTEKATVTQEARFGFFARLVQTLSQRLFARKVAVLTGATATAQAVLVLASPVLTRLYSPEDFGILAAYTSIIAILLVNGSLRYESAILLAPDDETAASVIALCLGVLLGITLLSAIGIWLLAGPIVRWSATPGLRHYLWLLPVSLLGAGVYQVFDVWATRKRIFGQMGRATVYQSAGQIIAQTSLGISKVGPAGLLLGDAVGRVIGSGALVRLAWQQERHTLKRVSLAAVKYVAHRYRRFPLLSGASALLNTVSTQVPGLLLASFYGPQVLGWYFLAERVSGAPLNLLSNSVAQVYTAELAKMVRTSPAGVERLFWNTLKSMLLVGIPLVLSLWIASPWLFSFVFGNKWTQAGVYLRVLAVMYLLQFVCGWTGRTLDVLERQDLHLVRELTRLAFTASAIILARLLQQSAMTAIIYLGISGAVSYLVYGSISWLAIRDFSRRSQSC